MAGEIFARVQTGETAHFEWENRHADGTALPVDVTVCLARVGDELRAVYEELQRVHALRHGGEALRVRMREDRARRREDIWPAQWKLGDSAC